MKHSRAPGTPPEQRELLMAEAGELSPRTGRQTTSPTVMDSLGADALLDEYEELVAANKRAPGHAKREERIRDFHRK